jgi:hypothetical protein
MALGAFRGMTRQAAATAARSGVVLAVCLVAALALTACGSSRRGQPVPVVSATDLAATPETTTAETAAPAESVPATTKTAALPGDAAAEGTELPPPETYETAEPADPDAVMGLDRTEVEALLGEPGLVRREAPAEVWQYQSRGCVLDVFLYEASADFQVAYLEARDGQAIAATTATCLGAVMDQRRRTPTS